MWCNLPFIFFFDFSFEDVWSRWFHSVFVEGNWLQVKWTDELRCTGNRSCKQRERRKKEHSTGINTENFQVKGWGQGVGVTESHWGQFLQGHWAGANEILRKYFIVEESALSRKPFHAVKKLGQKVLPWVWPSSLQLKEPAKRQEVASRHNSTGEC